MADTEYRYVLSKTEVEDTKQIERLQKIYNDTDIIATFGDSGAGYNFRKFPYTNIKECPLIDIEIKTN
jgi:5-bromo-4-chloroindolyl phosphate hydrolysis protein